ncbi:MAG: SDR family oxidoreductase [Omnitrophica WOR_2 bacterium]
MDRSQNRIYHEQVVIITGASRGLGREMACQLAGQGAWLVLAARDSSRLEEVAGECLKRGENLGCRVIAIPTDISEEAQCERLIEQALAAYNRIDILINNAATMPEGWFRDTEDLAPFETMLRVNYLGSVYCTRTALPSLLKNRGRVAAVCSLAGRMGIPRYSGYAASKHAMAGFFDSLRIELSNSGVSVTVIYPGTISKGPAEAGMPVGEVARRALKAIAARKDESVLDLQGKLGLWMKLAAPGLLDRITLNAMKKRK